MREPLISVVIPMYNAESYIGEAIESVLNQDYSQREVLVVDDGSVDGGAVVVKRFPGVRYIYQENQGPAVARNRGVIEASGGILAFLDSDDIWLPHKLSRQVPVLLAAETPSFVICETRLCFKEGVTMPPGYSQRMVETAHPAHLPSALVVSREVFYRVGEFDPLRRKGQDTDWFLRASDAGIKCLVVPELLFEKRIHDTNLTGSVEETRRSMMMNLRASILRKRMIQEQSEKNG